MIEQRKVPPARILRSLMVITGTGTRLFSDRIRYGYARSFKVWGWQREMYEEAAWLLRKHGYSANIVETRGYRKTVRLWVG